MSCVCYYFLDSACFVFRSDHLCYETSIHFQKQFGYPVKVSLELTWLTHSPVLPLSWVSNLPTNSPKQTNYPGRPRTNTSLNWAKLPVLVFPGVQLERHFKLFRVTNIIHMSNSYYHLHVCTFTTALCIPMQTSPASSPEYDHVWAFTLHYVYPCGHHPHLFQNMWGDQGVALGYLSCGHKHAANDHILRIPLSISHPQLHHLYSPLDTFTLSIQCCMQTCKPFG